MSSSGLTRSDFNQLVKDKNKPLLIKFSADWCAPCKKIKPTVDEHVKNLGDRVIFLEIDIDESLDVYATMKGKRMLSGIPTLMFYEKDNREFYPTLTTTGGSIDMIETFFSEILEMV